VSEFSLTYHSEFINASEDSASGGGDLKGQLQGASAAVLYGAQTNYTALHVALLLHSDPFNPMRRQAVHLTNLSAKADSVR
jgi:hypothetical protein